MPALSPATPAAMQPTLEGMAVDLGVTLSALSQHLDRTVTRVGTCPHCGYPSLDSGLCAYCRPFLAR